MGLQEEKLKRLNIYYVPLEKEKAKSHKSCSICSNQNPQTILKQTTTSNLESLIFVWDSKSHKYNQQFALPSRLFISSILTEQHTHKFQTNKTRRVANSTELCILQKAVRHTPPCLQILLVGLECLYRKQMKYLCILP